MKRSLLSKRLLRKIRRPRISRRTAIIGGISGVILVWLIATFPDITSLRRRVPERTALMTQRLDEAERAGKPLKLHQQWVSIGAMSPHLRRAVIVAEDSNFYTHRGFDFGEMQKAITESISDFSFPRGASTITQQLAKNLYLSESRNPLRKVREALITLGMESILSKERILEIYLNVIEWGDGIFGAAAAAEFYFGATVTSLTPEQAAFLAAIIPSPRGIFNPKLHRERVARRKEVILRRISNNIR